MSPACETYLTGDQLEDAEIFYPLHVRICSVCLLVQLPAHLRPDDVFSDYAYFSSYSDSWVAHAETYVAGIIPRLQLTGDSFVVEVASNDGYLLQHLVRRRIPVLGIEPAGNVAHRAKERGIPTFVGFLDEAVALAVVADHRPADLVVANNVLAHVPDLIGFVRGLRALVKPSGTVTLEFPHLLQLVRNRQFDTIYHEHYSYFSLLTASRALGAGGLTVVDVEELASHGGSLRVYAQPAEHAPQPTASVAKVLADEAAGGLDSLAGHGGFAQAVFQVKRGLLTFLLETASKGKTVAGYGAPGKGNTLLNHCGVRADLLRYTVDRNELKQGRYLPGTHIPIFSPERFAQTRPDYILLLPWNLRRELEAQLAYVRGWGGQLVVAIPELLVF